jgi:hypothetical protein
MGTFNLRSRGLGSFTRSTFVGVLSFAICFAPMVANADPITAVGSEAATGAGNTAASAMNNGLGAMTTAQGANSMAKGKQQMQCCKEGCDGAGKEATANKAGQDAAGQAGSQAVKPSFQAPEAPKPLEPIQWKPSPSGAFNFHSIPRATISFCSNASSTAQLSALKLFRPQRVEAAAGCNDAMMAMAQGAMQMLSGLAGLAAAMMGAEKAAKANSNAGNLSQIPNNGTPPATPAVLGGASLANDTGNTTPIKIDSALLRSGKADSIYREFEKNFGIPREDFANNLLKGVDPRSMLMNAPKNAFTAAELNQAFSAAKNMSQEQKDAAMAAAGLADLQRDLASKAAAAMTGEISAAGGKSSNKSSSKDLEELDLSGLDGKTAGAAGGSAGSNQLSPELQAALAEKDSAQMRVGTSIFEIVHTKYQEKMRQIYGFDSHGKSIGGKGVADANGF